MPRTTSTLVLFAWTLLAGDGWRRIEVPLELSFPRDHGSHPDTRTEWWYLTGEARDAEGNPFGFQFTIFRRGLEANPPTPSPRLRPSQVLAGHLAVVDVRAGRFLRAERVRRVDGALAFASEADLHVALDHWEIQRGEGDAITVTASGGVDGPRIHLTCRPSKPPVRQCEGGLSKKGPEPGNASAYVSWTRLAVEGTLGIGAQARSVKGEAWFDHEWGTGQLGAGVAGWDWFGIRLDDGRELMLYGLRREGGGSTEFSSGTVVSRDGATTHLTYGSFSMERLGSWTSPATGAAYPAGFRLRVPSEGIDVVARPPVADCELDTRATTGVVYWEGPIEVHDAASGRPAGRGYMELTGYAESMAGKF